MWGPGSDAEPYISAYALDFVMQAKDKGYIVPMDALRRGTAWLRRTASWQAAYNTACLYAALISERRASGASLSPEEEAWEDRVVISLERVASNPYAEMRRLFDVIAKDPDFHALRSAPEKFGAFDKFLSDQRRKDYPEVAVDARPTLTSVEPA